MTRASQTTHPAGDHARADLMNRLAFLELTPADVERLRALTPRFREFAHEFVERFYSHLFAFEATRAFLQDAALVEHLKQTQQRHFESMLQAAWDETYVADRRQVGHKHAEIGLQPELFLGAYNQYVQHCFRHFLAGASPAEQAGLESLLSVLKAIFLDVGLTLDAYFESSTNRLRHALDLFWKANIELRQFTQLASHDLKTPLATVANLCDEALDEFGSEMPLGARELIEAARQRTFRMSQMIDELLALGGSEGMETNSEISSQEAFNEALERVRPVLEKKQIALEVSKPLPMVWGNKVRLRETFYNLLSNAAKFIQRRPGKITVSCELRAADCLFSVADNGPGIPREELTQIFLPFRRLVATGSTPGSGLGLYFAKNMIERQEGQIWAESESGAGTQFFVQLHRYQP